MRRFPVRAVGAGAALCVLALSMAAKKASTPAPGPAPQPKTYSYPVPMSATLPIDLDLANAPRTVAINHQITDSNGQVWNVTGSLLFTPVGTAPLPSPTPSPGPTPTPTPTPNPNQPVLTGVFDTFGNLVLIGKFSTAYVLKGKNLKPTVPNGGLRLQVAGLIANITTWGDGTAVEWTMPGNALYPLPASGPIQIFWYDSSKATWQAWFTGGQFTWPQK